MREAFTEPQFDGPIRLEERMDGCASDASVRGMFFQTITRAAEKRSGRRPGRDRYVAFMSYPLTEWMETLLECAKLAHPEVPPRHGVFRLGQGSYDTFTESMVGRVLFSAAGRDVKAAARLIPRGYEVAGNQGSVTLSELEDDHAVVAMRGYWDWPEWHLGTLLGGVRAFGKEGAVTVRELGLADYDCRVEWR